MIEKTATITKDTIYTEVKIKTAYEAEKSGDKSLLERVATIDEDTEVLDRFWNEAKNGLCVALRRYLKTESEASGTYSVTLNLSGSFDTALWQTMTGDLESYFITSIVAKWLSFSLENKAKEYASASASFIESFLRKACFVKKPTRETVKYLWNCKTVTYSDGTMKDVAKYLIGEYNGISSVTQHYALSDSSEETPETWATTVSLPTAEKPYLWCYTTATYSGGKTTDTEMCVVYEYNASKTASSLTESYTVSTSAAAEPPTWRDSISKL